MNPAGYSFRIWSVEARGGGESTSRQLRGASGSARAERRGLSRCVRGDRDNELALLLENDALFLHIPKTAGMWVSRVLRDLGLVRCRVATKHADMERVLHCARYLPGRYVQAVVKAGPRWQRRVRRSFKFCFVRHPLAWYESYWLFMQSRGWNRWGVDRRGRPRWHPNARLDGLGSEDFNVFMRAVLEAQPGYVGTLYGWYATDEIDFVGKQEQVTEDLVAVLAQLGVTFDEPRVRAASAVNVSPDPEGRPRWDPGLLRETLRAERAALERFGYTEERERRAARS